MQKAPPKGPNTMEENHAGENPATLELERRGRNDLEPGRYHCHRCHEITSWTPVRGRAGRQPSQRCVQCGDRFPCARCTHSDCSLARGAYELDRVRERAPAQMPLDLAVQLELLQQATDLLGWLDQVAKFRALTEAEQTIAIACRARILPVTVRP